MSPHQLRLIPTDPPFVPDDDAAFAALDPDVADPTGEQSSELERPLGMPRRRIWSRY